MTQKNNSTVIDCTRGLTRDQRAVNRSIKRGDVPDCTGGLTREQRAITRSIKRHDASPSVIATGITTCRRKKRQQNFHEQWTHKMERYLDQWFLDTAADEEQFGCHELGDKVVSDSTYEEEPFGDNIVDPLPPANYYTVSLALFDGAEMLFACSGITLPHGPEGEHITRFVTSNFLVTKFKAKRNKDDKLRIEVRLPNNRVVDGFLGLYDRDIAIVTSFDFLPDVCPINLDCQLAWFNLEDVVAFGRAFKSGQLMSKHLQQTIPYPVSDDGEPRKVLFPLFTEAALGASLTTSSGEFCGIIHKEVTSEIWSLPPSLLRQRLMHFGVLKKEDEDTDDAVSSSGGTRGSRHKYSLPDNVETIVPSGFMRNINLIKSMGYPTPPPLMLELNGKLLNTFEDDFGEVSAWEGYDCNLMCRCAEYVWHKLPGKVFTDISRRAVSVVSFKGEQIYFACTGLLISWHVRTRTRVRTSMGMCTRMHTRSVILTSASLVRSCDDEDEIDRNLRIEVFLPPHQRAEGRLELYHLNYNIAIISVEKHFLAARPENIFYRVQKPSENVVAIGREAAEGLLLATLGEVTDMPRMCPSELDCGDLKVSTCKIKKVGIGGPLINSDDGSLVGMNFYDDTDETPFLPRSKIVDVLKGIDLPSRSGSDCPVNMMNDSAVKKNRWPVPEAYWYHPLLDKDWDPFPPHVGRVLQ